MNAAGVRGGRGNRSSRRGGRTIVDPKFNKQRRVVKKRVGVEENLPTTGTLRTSRYAP